MNKAPLLAEELHDFILSGGFMYGFYGSKDKARAFHERSRVRKKEAGDATDRIRRFDLLHTTLARLTKDGLIARKQVSRKSVFSVTAEGAEKCREWRRWLSSHPPAPVPIGAPVRYEKVASSSSIIVSFDIPEREASKRAWLRSSLKNLDFKILHRSTWIGDTVLPKELIAEIHRLKMDTYVKIFSVVRYGTTRA